ncbi:MAG: ATP-binding cassette domain-containing protein [Gemmatimonadota bacterium]|nr:ATP-binding cassette domain-containing protein [Gemmatimonadota bacterium]MDH5758523.1 ATP-binding cassette domain-containing protein [Gemmatimonadota bacterium]
MIHVSGLTKQFGDLAAVRDLSFQVDRGEVYALLGANGAGKTTALRCIATLLRPTGGRVEVEGWSTSSTPIEVRRRIAFLATSTGLYERLTPRELVTYFGRLQGMDDASLEARVDAVVDLFALGEFQHRLCGQLSHGQRQRVSLARVLVHDPPVLILDEPTLGLDLVSGGAIHRFIQRERDRGKAVLFSSHRMEAVELLADRVGVMDEGRLVAEGTVADLVSGVGASSLAQAFLRLVGAEEGVAP